MTFSENIIRKLIPRFGTTQIVSKLSHNFIFYYKFFISIDYITIVPNLGINLRIMFSENVMDDDL